MIGSAVHGRLRAVAAGLALTLLPGVAAAHALDSTFQLPVPRWLYLAGAAVAVIASFVRRSSSSDRRRPTHATGAGACRSCRRAPCPPCWPSSAWPVVRRDLGGVRGRRHHAAARGAVLGGDLGRTAGHRAPRRQPVAVAVPVSHGARGRRVDRPAPRGGATGPGTPLPRARRHAGRRCSCSRPASGRSSCSRRRPRRTGWVRSWSATPSSRWWAW